jgi:MbtH protein
MTGEERDDRDYTAVVNDEEQYSMWLADRKPPAGWRRTGEVGSKADCLAFIEKVWVDMRPRSVRRDTEESG